MATAKETPVPEMCAGCAHNKKMYCEVVKEPIFFYTYHGKCFSWVNEAQAKEIEKEIAFLNGKQVRRRRKSSGD